MANVEIASTKNKILDKAESAYALTGMTDFTLRTLTEQAGVNLASINYHFKSKQALVEAMLLRVLNPFCDEQIGLLNRLKVVYGPNLQPTHVVSATLLPFLREIEEYKADNSVHRLDFIQRAALDAAPLIRGFISERFAATSQTFDDAFSQSAPNLSNQEAVWRSHLFCNALPGSVINGSVLSMSVEMLNRPNTHWSDVLVQMAVLIESVMTGSSNRAHVHYLISDMLDSLSSMATLKALNPSRSRVVHGDRETRTAA